MRGRERDEEEGRDFGPASATGGSGASTPFLTCSPSTSTLRPPHFRERQGGGGGVGGGVSGEAGKWRGQTRGGGGW